VKADVEYWSLFKILARAPSTSGIAQVWVVTSVSDIVNPDQENADGCLYTNQPITNFFIYGF
jgi:hypothetical protein